MNRAVAPQPLQRGVLRKQLRDRRNRLTPQQQQTAARRLAYVLLQEPRLYRARHIAVYLANDGEIDPSAFMTLAAARGIRLYLPVLHPIHRGTLVFSRYSPGAPLRRNRFGIPEPAFSAARERPPWALDAVLMPLVGFDSLGGRLGMGGGFYDRTFAFSRHRPRLCPKLIGLAHTCQQVEQLPMASWDIPLHGVATDAGFQGRKHF